MTVFVSYYSPLEFGEDELFMVLRITPQDADQLLFLMDTAESLTRELADPYILGDRYKLSTLGGPVAPDIVSSWPASIDVDLVENFEEELRSEGGFEWVEAPPEIAAAVMSTTLGQWISPRTEYVELVVSDNDLYWNVMLRYAENESETNCITRAQLEEIAAQNMWAADHDFIPLLQAFAIMRSGCGAQNILYPSDVTEDVNRGLFVAEVEMHCSESDWTRSIRHLERQLELMVDQDIILNIIDPELLIELTHRNAALRISRP